MKIIHKVIFMYVKLGSFQSSVYARPISRTEKQTQNIHNPPLWPNKTNRSPTWPDVLF